MLGIAFIGKSGTMLTMAVKKRDTEGKFFLPKQMAHEFLSKRNKGWQAHGTFFRGITCECCQHRCSLPELTQYCAEPVEKRTINWPSHRKRATGSDVTDPNELIAVEPTRQAGVAEKTYRDIRRLESKSIPRQQLERHVRSS
ncbi:hypothetical protein LSAT2_016195 [Lamellibrachia satsuma]|nr:hypothetical protein LSAT2_016195 [Lamellibrachia satsuma]